MHEAAVSGADVSLVAERHPRLPPGASSRTQRINLGVHFEECKNAPFKIEQ